MRFKPDKPTSCNKLELSGNRPFVYTVGRYKPLQVGLQAPPDRGIYQVHRPS